MSKHKLSRGSEYRAATETALKKVFREKAAEEVEWGRNVAFISAAKNEYESFQVIVGPSDGKRLKSVEVALSDIAHADTGFVIPKEEIETNLVGYVETKHVEHTRWWPDPLLPMEPFDVAEDRVQPVWVTIRVPKEAPAGEYSGAVRIKPSNAPEREIAVRLRVWDFELPDKSRLSTVFGLTTMDVMSRFYDFYPGTEREQSQMVLKYLDFMADHRINTLFYGYLTARDPRCISIQKGDDGRFRYDFSRVDPYLERLVEKDMRFNIFAPSFWHQAENMFRMNPLLAPFAHLGDRVFESPEFDQVVADLLMSYVAHLKEKGWLEHAFAYVWDEPPERHYGHMRKMCDLVKKVAPELKRLTVANHPPEPLEGYSDIWCPNVGAGPEEAEGRYERDRAFYERRQRAGDEVWWYIACAPHPYPNFFLDYPALDCRIPFWMTWRYGLDGLAYWNLNVWDYDVPGMSHGRNFRDSANERWPQAAWDPSWTCSANCEVAPCQGNGQLIYPGPEGPIGSLRLKVIRDGIEDYEVLRLLEERTAAVADRRDSAEKDALLSRSEQLLTAARCAACTTQDYERDPAKLLSLRDRIGEQVEALTRAL
jgi:hypothetical protein